MRLDPQEGELTDDSHREQGDDQRACPAVVVGLDQGVDQRAQRDDGEELTGQVERAALGVGRLPHGAQRDDKREDADRHVDEEHALPAQRVDEHAADDGTRCQGQARDAGPQADRLGAFLGVGEGGDEDRKRARQQRCRADTLEGATRDEPVQRRCQAAQQRAAREDHEPGEEEPLATIEVAEHPTGEHETGEEQRVGRDDPLQAGHA